MKRTQSFSALSCLASGFTCSSSFFMFSDNILSAIDTMMMMMNFIDLSTSFTDSLVFVLFPLAPPSAFEGGRNIFKTNPLTGNERQGRRTLYPQQCWKQVMILLILVLLVVVSVFFLFSKRKLVQILLQNNKRKVEKKNIKV